MRSTATEIPNELTTSSPENSLDHVEIDCANTSPIIEGEFEDSSESLCSAQCTLKCFNLKTTLHLNLLANLGNKKFPMIMYNQFPWISVSVTYGRVFCLYCDYCHAEKQQRVTFSKCGETTSTKSGFQNWKKPIENFKVMNCPIITEKLS